MAAPVSASSIARNRPTTERTPILLDGCFVDGCAASFTIGSEAGDPSAPPAATAPAVPDGAACRRLRPAAVDALRGSHASRQSTAARGAQRGLPAMRHHGFSAGYAALTSTVTTEVAASHGNRLRTRCEK